MPEPASAGPPPDNITLYDTEKGAPIAFPSPEEAAAAFQQGTHSVLSDADVRMFDADGSPITVAGRDAGQILEGGGRFATSGEVARVKAEQERHEKYGGLGGKAIAAVTGALDFPTAGLGDAAIAKGAEFLNPEWGKTVKEAIKGSQAENPGTYHTAQAGGAIASLLTGEGEIAGGGRALTGLARALPGSAIMKGGALIEEGVAKGLTGLASKGVLGRATATAAEMAARGAAETTAFSMGEAIKEEALGDHEFNAEALSTIGKAGLEGLVTGAALGGALGAGGSLVKSGAVKTYEAGKNAAKAGWEKLADRFTPKDVEAIAESHFGYVPEGLGEAAEKELHAVDKAHKEHISGLKSALNDPERVAAPMGEMSPNDLSRLDAKGMRARQLAVEAKDISNTVARDIETHGNELLKSVDAITLEGKGELKAAQVAKAVQRGNEDEVLTSVASRVHQLREGLAELGADPERMGYGKKLFKSLQASIDRGEARMTEAYAAHGVSPATGLLESGEHANAKAFVAMDDLKRDLQTYTKNMSPHLMSDPVEKRMALKVRDWIKAEAEGLQSHLEDANLWGQAGRNQKAINAAWSAQLGWQEEFRNRLLTKFGRNAEDLYMKDHVIDPKRVETYLNSLTNPRNSLDHKAVTEYLASTKNLAKVMGETYQLPAAKMAEIQKAVKAVDTMSAAIEKNKEALIRSNQLRDIVANEKGPAAGTMGAIGSLVLGPMGGLAGAAYGILSKPGRTITQLAAVEQLVRQTRGQMQKAAKGVVAEKVASAAKGAPEKAKQAAKSAVRSESRSEARDKLNKRYEDALTFTRKVQEAAADPVKVSDHVSRVVGPDAPNTSASLSSQVVRMGGYLAAQQPKAVHTSSLPMMGSQAPASVPDHEKFQYIRKVDAVRSPEGVLKRFEQGVVTPAEVDALRQNHPKLYAEFENMVAMEVGKKMEKGEKIPFATRQKLTVMFGKEFDPVFQPNVQNSLQSNLASEQKPQDNPNLGGPPPDVLAKRPIAMKSPPTGFDEVETR